MSKTVHAGGRIDVLLPGRHLETIMLTAFGLPMQMALLENGQIAVADSSNQRIVLVEPGGQAGVLAEIGIPSNSVAALPGNRVVYSVNREIRVHDVLTGRIERRGALPSGEFLNALGGDSAGFVYAATSQRSLYRFGPDGSRDLLASNLPFDTLGYAITDIAVGKNGEIYVAGFRRVVRIDSGAVRIIADNLHFEPVWVAVRPDGRVYVNEVTRRLQIYDPLTNGFGKVAVPSFSPFGDILAASDDEILFHGSDVIFRYNFASGQAAVVFSNIGNSFAFAAGTDGFLYFGTPHKAGVMQSRLVRLGADGRIQYLNDFPFRAFKAIQALEVDTRGRLCVIADGMLTRVEANGSLTKFSSFVPKGARRLAVSGNDDWYVATTNRTDSIQIYRIREGQSTGQVVASLDRTFFPTGVSLDDVSIAVTPKGQLAVIASAVKWGGAGPCYQRLYRANADGSGLREVANLDSERTGCLIDIASAPNGDLYALVCGAGPTGSPDVIFLIDESNVPKEAVRIEGGNDPRSISLDDQGILWFCATNGVYRVVASPPGLWGAGVINSASWKPEIASNTWITIFGANLAPLTRSWTGSDFVGGRLPVALDGVGVSVGGRPGYVAYISPRQLNVLAPELPAPGPVEVKVTTPAGMSNTVSVSAAQFAPALFRFDAAGGRYAAAVHADGNYVGDPTLLPGIGASPARPGEILSLFGTGFGPVTGNLDIGSLVAAPLPLASSITFKIGGLDAPTRFAGLVGPGLYQFNVEVPQVADGDQSVSGFVGGVPLHAGTLISVATSPR